MQPTLYDVFRVAIAEADLVNAASAILGDRWPGRVAEEAKTVRLIYKLFISGLSVHRIAKYLTEEQIRQMFITAVNQLAEVKQQAAANIRMLAETVCDTDALASERDGLCGELDALSGSIERMVKENARTAIDQEAYREKEDRLCGIYTEKYERLQEVERLIEEKEDKRAILAGVAEQLQTVEGGIAEFDPELWGGLVERIDVDKHAATVVFRGGIAIGV